MAVGGWRDEQFSTLRVDTAKEILDAFYEIQRALHRAGAQIVLANQMARDDGASDEAVREAAHAPIWRISQSYNALTELRTKRHLFADLFGQDATKPWHEVEEMITEIVVASDAILMLRGEHPPLTHPQAELYQRQQQILAQTMNEDTITPRVDAAVREIRSICLPILRAWERF